MGRSIGSQSPPAFLILMTREYNEPVGLKTRRRGRLTLHATCDGCIALAACAARAGEPCRSSVLTKAWMEQVAGPSSEGRRGFSYRRSRDRPPRPFDSI